LFVLHKGPLFNFDDCIAIVGTRDPSFYGRMMARRISKSLASKGYTIASGLARGIDEWAHCGALEAPRGRTIAVLAWMDPIYPSEHRQLADDIIKKGAIISERFMNPKDRSGPSKFVQRNRITSGISRCVIAVESGKEGGTIHQIRIALDQRRKVFALKPKESNKRAKEGFNVFMDMGATPIKSARDLLKHLQEDLPGKERKLDSFSQHSIDRF
jgi:DNA processing protein